jgi:hypothetical protein
MDVAKSSGVDTGSVFTLSVPAAEIVLRGGVLYIALYLLLRFIPRQASFGFIECLALVLVADASQSAMAGESISLAEIALLAATLAACHLAARLLRALARRLRRASLMARRLQHAPDLSSTLTERKPS